MDYRSEGELIAYRIAHASHPVFDGGGAFKHGSRWCSPGRWIVHAAGSYALAVLENLVHWNRPALPPDMHYVRIRIPESVSRRLVDPAEVPGWSAFPYGASQTLGDAWYDVGEHAVLIVPSVLSPFEPNLLINQRHSGFAAISVSAPVPAVLDRRLFVTRG